MLQLVLAACLSRLASRMFALVIVLYVLQRFDSPVLAGWVVFASMAPGLVISPLAGALLDRMGAAKAIVIDMGRWGGAPAPLAPPPAAPPHPLRCCAARGQVCSMSCATLRCEASPSPMRCSR